MKIGILSGIDVHKSKLDWGGSAIASYIRFLKSTGFEFEGYGYEAAQGQLPTTAEACDAYVITGSPKGAYDRDPWIGELMRFIRDGVEADKKFVGICFGHQVLAQALGGHVEKSEKGWGLGLRTLQLQQSKPWMGDGARQMQLYFAHQDQVQRLPAGAELLGGNDFCPVGMYAIGEQVLGIQGHPEFKESHMRDVLRQRKQQGLTAEAEDAEATLNDGDPDGEMVAGWIVDFLAL